MGVRADDGRREGRPESGEPEEPQRSRVVYFTPAEVTVLVERDPRAPSLPGPEASAEERAAALGEANEAVRKLVGDGLPFPLAQQTFARVGGRGERRPLFFDDGRRTFVVQTVNLQGWQPDPEARYGEMLEGLTAVAVAVEKLNEANDNERNERGRGLVAGNYELVTASPTWLPMPLENGDG